jgi:hypothetical protein
MNGAQRKPAGFLQVFWHCPANRKVRLKPDPTLQDSTAINAELAEIAEIYWLSSLSEFCVQRRGCSVEMP